jgi:hypothetical protein
VKQDLVALLRDVEVAGQGIETAVDDPRLVVEVPGHSLRGVGDPDSAVVEVYLLGGNAPVSERKSSQSEDEQSDNAAFHPAANC